MRSLNKVILIGNLTREPELRYTPQGNAVCSFGIATNREYRTAGGENKEEAEFHNVVAWNKLAELCGKILSKGRKVYIEGRIHYSKFTDKTGVERDKTEIILNDMLLLDRKPMDDEQPKTEEEISQ